MLENILQDINDRVSMDADAAKAFFGLKKPPGANWLAKIEPGVAAAQAIVNEALTIGSGSPALDAALGAPAGKPDGAEDDFGLGMDKTTPAAVAVVAPSPKEAELLTQLRARLRCGVDADISTIASCILAGGWARREMMLTPLAQPILPWVHFAHMAQIRTQPWLGYYQETDTIIQVARNKCADAFLKSEAEWSWWVDGDIVPSWGDPAFFYDVKRLAIPPGRIGQDFLQTKTLDRLKRAGKTIVGAVYQQRRRAGHICSPADLRPHPAPEERDAVLRLRTKGPIDKLLEVDWCATGCLLVHRSVYEDIKRKRPDLAPRQEGAPWNFFGHNVGEGGEDAAFGVLAKECGHQSYLDLGCWVAHLGNFAFMPEPI